MRYAEPRVTKDLDIWPGHPAASSRRWRVLALRFAMTGSLKILFPWSRRFIKSAFHPFAWIF
jgi:hypothetical protein